MDRLEKQKTLRKLYEDALYMHLLDLGYTKDRAQYELNKRYRKLRDYQETD